MLFLHWSVHVAGLMSSWLVRIGIRPQVSEEVLEPLGVDYCDSRQWIAVMRELCLKAHARALTVDSVRQGAADGIKIPATNATNTSSTCFRSARSPMPHSTAGTRQAYLLVG
jgi:hypothetical protein